MKQIIICSHAKPILRVPWNFGISRIVQNKVRGTTSPLELFKNFNYRPEIYWADAQYHEADCYLKWPCSANVCTFHGTLKFSPIGLGQEVQIEKSHYGLKFGGIVQFTMKRITVNWPHTANVRIFVSRRPKVLSFSECLVFTWIV